MPGKAVGQAAVELPWLCPNTDSLIALADAPASVCGLSAADPALAVFLHRFVQPAPEPDSFGFAPGALHTAVLPETANAFLGATPAGVLPESSLALDRVHSFAARAAEYASGLAETTRLVPSHAAETVVRLAPLGWYAVAAVDPFDAADPLNDPGFTEHSAEVQKRVWGLDHASIARRLAVRWRLPSWIATTISSMTLPLTAVGGLTSHRDLFAIAQLAIIEAESEGVSLGLSHGSHRGELLDHLHLGEAELEQIRTARRQPAKSNQSQLNQNPHKVHLIRNLLRLAGECRRRNGPGLVARLEERIDVLHSTVAELGGQVGDRLRDAKLAGLAELAAGAGHEINNPLAIISGNAQRLLRTESDPARSDSLQAIVRQANRIAGLLRDLMQFARPPKPDQGTFAAIDMMRAVQEELTPLAIEREVRLELVEHPVDTWLIGDVKQLRHALAAIVRNAVEATPRDGWVRLSMTDPEGEPPVITVEDSGPGLTPEAVEHAFDPFFCGRIAGRGRGLGLPTAWQLVRLNGGELRFHPSEHSPTRFELRLRRANGFDLLTLRSA